MGKLLALIRGILLLLSIIIFVSVYWVSLLVSKNTVKRRFRLRRNWVRIALILMGIRVKIEGESTASPVLFVSNHRSFSDPVVTSIAINAFVIAKAEVADLPIISKGVELTGVVYVKREDKDSRNATRQKMISILTEGDNVMVYPEGTTNVMRTTKDFKKGTFHEVAKLGIPVVPIAIEYRDEVDMWGEGGLIAQYFRQFSKLVTYVKVHIGPEIIEEDGYKLTIKSKSWIDQQLLEMQKGWSRVYPN